MNRETMKCDDIPLPISRIGLGSWAIGGWMWGGSDEAESIRTIQHAVDLGINLIDTAPVYGFGRSEEIVGKALADGGRRDHGKSLLAFAIRWILDRGETMTALWGARKASQLDAAEEAFGWKLSQGDYAEVDKILRETITNPVGPEFMAPPQREPVPV
jgi:aryl-alcohol dehydrogenase-like predicted oxidoreductase